MLRTSVYQSTDSQSPLWKRGVRGDLKYLTKHESWRNPSQSPFSKGGYGKSASTVVSGSHAPRSPLYTCLAEIEITVISAWMPKSSVQGWQSPNWGGCQIKHIRNHQVTILGLDSGIHAGMTGLSLSCDCRGHPNGPAMRAKQSGHPR